LLFHSRMSLFLSTLCTLIPRICHIAHWIATLRRLGCNLRYSYFFSCCLCSFFALQELLLGNFTPNNIEFFSFSLTPSFHLFFNHFLTSSSSPMLWSAMEQGMTIRCECCYTSSQSVRRNEVIYYDTHSPLPFFWMAGSNGVNWVSSQQQQQNG
jgi:hypothetical protein